MVLARRTGVGRGGVVVNLQYKMLERLTKIRTEQCLLGLTINRWQITVESTFSEMVDVGDNL